MMKPLLATAVLLAALPFAHAQDAAAAAKEKGAVKTPSGLQHPHLVAGAGEGDPRRKAVRTGSDDRRANHAASLPRQDVRSWRR